MNFTCFVVLAESFGKSLFPHARLAFSRLARACKHRVSYLGTSRATQLMQTAPWLCIRRLPEENVHNAGVVEQAAPLIRS
jgi:L-asparaginase II